MKNKKRIVMMLSGTVFSLFVLGSVIHYFELFRSAGSEENIVEAPKPSFDEYGIQEGI
ncbi:MAG: hypothetical protein GX587_00755, partial [Bacteroidales bacterium]|nr:hypothetical protein [Bacteroidales bacterium]